VSWDRYDRTDRRPRRRRRRFSAASCAVGCGVVALAFAFGALYALSGRDEAPVLTGPDRERTAVELTEVKAAVERVKKDADAGVESDFTIGVTDDQLNLWLSEDEAVRRNLTERKIEDAWVSIHDGAISATVLRAVSTLTVQMKATLTPEIESPDRIRVRVTDMSVGRFGAPRAAAERLAEEIGRLLTDRIRKPNVVFTAVRIEGNRIEIVGRTEKARER